MPTYHVIITQTTTRMVAIEALTEAIAINEAKRQIQPDISCAVLPNIETLAAKIKCGCPINSYCAVCG